MGTLRLSQILVVLRRTVILVLMLVVGQFADTSHASAIPLEWNGGKSVSTEGSASALFDDCSEELRHDDKESRGKCCAAACATAAALPQPSFLLFTIGSSPKVVGAYYGVQGTIVSVLQRPPIQ